MTRELSEFTDEELRSVVETIDVLLPAETIVKAEDPRLAKIKRRYEASIGVALRGKFAELETVLRSNDIEQIMARARELFGDELAEDLRPEIERHLRDSFAVGQKVLGVPAAVAVAWDSVRQEALDWLVSHDTFWIGKIFPQYLEPAFHDTVAAGLEEGLGAKQIGARLQRQTLVGTAEAPAQRYLYDRVAGTTINRSRNWGGVYSMRDAGIVEYAIRAVIDRKTSQMCREMDGKVFRVADASAQVDRLMASDPADVENIAPWARWDPKRGENYLRGPKGRRDYIPGKSTEWLSDHGLSLPPYHGECLLPGTTVLTTSGWKPVERLSDGDRVLTHRGRWSPIADISWRWYSGGVTCFRTETGQSTVTDDHPALTVDGWRPAGGFDDESADTVFQMRSGLYGSEEPPDEEVLFSSMQGGVAARQGAAEIQEYSRTSKGLPPLRNAHYGERGDGAHGQREVLFKRMQKGVPDYRTVGAMRRVRQEALEGTACRRSAETTLLLTGMPQPREGARPLGELQGKGARAQRRDVGAVAQAPEADPLHFSHGRSSEVPEHLRTENGSVARRRRDSISVRAQARPDEPSHLRPGLLPPLPRSLDRNEGLGQTRTSPTRVGVQRNPWPASPDLRQVAEIFRNGSSIRITKGGVEGVRVFSFDVPGDESFVSGGGVILHNCRTTYTIRRT